MDIYINMNMNKRFILIEMTDPDTMYYHKIDPGCVVTAASANKAALLFVSQILKNSRKGKVVRKLKIQSVEKNPKQYTRTVVRYREETLPVNGTRFRYIHKLILKQT